jgi:hypothetical protein
MCPGTAIHKKHPGDIKGSAVVDIAKGYRPVVPGVKRL